jgi:hypothetical protein
MSRASATAERKSLLVAQSDLQRMQAQLALQDVRRIIAPPPQRGSRTRNAAATVIGLALPFLGAGRLRGALRVHRDHGVPGAAAMDGAVGPRFDRRSLPDPATRRTPRLPRSPRTETNPVIVFFVFFVLLFFVFQALELIAPVPGTAGRPAP